MKDAIHQKDTQNLDRLWKNDRPFWARTLPFRLVKHELRTTKQCPALTWRWNNNETMQAASLHYFIDCTVIKKHKMFCCIDCTRVCVCVCMGARGAHPEHQLLMHKPCWLFNRHYNWHGTLNISQMHMSVWKKKAHRECLKKGRALKKLKKLLSVLKQWDQSDILFTSWGAGW